MDTESPRPLAPTLEMPEPTEQDKQLAIDDVKLAQAYFHPAWEKVQDRFMAEIANAKSHPSPALPADEYKVEGLARDKYVEFLTNLMEEIKNAVTAVGKGK